jgi:uncharacterized membrane protein
MKLHPAIVHFPIALLCTAVLFASLSLFVKKEIFKQITFWNLILGVAGTIAAAISGLMEEGTFIHNEQIHELLVKHKFNGITILVVFLSMLVWLWMRKNKMGNKEYTTWVVCSFLALGLIFYQGFLGGEMVFEQGAGVKPMEQQLQKSEGGSASHSHAHEKTDSLHLDSSDMDHSKMPMNHKVATDSVTKKKELKGMKY